MYNKFLKYSSIILWLALCGYLVRFLNLKGCKKEHEEASIPVERVVLGRTSIKKVIRTPAKVQTKPVTGTEDFTPPGTDTIPPVQDNELPPGVELEEDEAFVPPEGKVEIHLDSNNEIQTKVTDRGFCFRPGLQGVVPFGLGYGKPGPGIGLDLKFVYFKRFGFGAGFVYSHSRGTRTDSFDLTSGFTYHLGGKLFKNTELAFGIQNFNQKTPYIGVRISL